MLTLFVLVVGLVGTSSLAFAQGTLAIGEPRGAISGQLNSETGGALAGAVILYNRVSDAHLGPDRRWVFTGPDVRGRIVADQNGAFRIGKLVPGLYLLCAIGNRAEHLMTCDWGEHYRRVELRPNKEVNDVRMTVSAGVLLRFRILDAAGRLGAPGQRIGVRSTNGVYKAASLVARNGATVEYRLAVPKRGRFDLLVHNISTLADSAGRPLPANAVAFQIDSGDGAERIIDLVAR